MSQPTPAATATDRSRRKTEIGIVTSDKMNKTRRVEVETLVPHPKYGKLMKRRTVCHAHDETNQTHVGDIVEIMETRPLSKLEALAGRPDRPPRRPAGPGRRGRGRRPPRPPAPDEPSSTAARGPSPRPDLRDLATRTDRPPQVSS